MDGRGSTCEIARNAEFRLETGELSQKNNNRVSLTGYGTNDTGTLQTPGGHLEHGEDLGACAVRETEEETGLVVTAGNVITITNDVFNGEGKHYITIFVDCAMTDPNATPEVKQISLICCCKDNTSRVGELTLG